MSGGGVVTEQTGNPIRSWDLDRDIRERVVGSETRVDGMAGELETLEESSESSTLRRWGYATLAMPGVHLVSRKAAVTAIRPALLACIDKPSDRASPSPNYLRRELRPRYGACAAGFLQGTLSSSAPTGF